MKKAEVLKACRFTTKTVLGELNHAQVWNVYKSITDVLGQETADRMFNDKDITIKPLTSGEIQQLAFYVMKNKVVEETLFDKTDKEILEVLRENSGNMSEYLDAKNYSERLTIDSESTTSETVFSKSNLWAIIKENLPFEIPLKIA